MAGFFLARLPSYPKPDDGIGKSLVPAVAAAASWMETFKMPLREIHAKYTRSEMGIQAWRSGELASNMHVQYQSVPSERATGALESSYTPSASAYESVLEERIGQDILGKFDDDMDMRKLTGDQVMRYMQAMGISVGGRMLGGS